MRQFGLTLIGAVAMTVLVTTAGAQPRRVAPVGLQRTALVQPALSRMSSVQSDSVDAGSPGPGAGAGRFAISSVGAFIGAIGGFAAAWSYETRGCSDCGMSADAATPYVAFGSGIGAVLGSAAFPLGSPCSFSQRMGRSLLGAMIGGGIAAAAGSISEERGTLIWMSALGSTAGSTVGVHTCR